MERYIGVLKSKVSLMSNIDMDLANKVLIMENLNYLPSQAPLHQTTTFPDRDQEFPQPPTDIRLMFKLPIRTDWLEFLKSLYKAEERRYPIRSNIIILWKKYHIRYGCFVGSKSSQNNNTLTNRDDSFIWWKHEDNGRQLYGQVLVFAICYDWEPIAIVKPYQKVKENRSKATKWVVNDMRGLTGVKAKLIGGLIGRIKIMDGRKTVVHIVGSS